MDVGKLLEHLIAQNDLVIRQNEKILLHLAERANRADAELLDEIRVLYGARELSSTTKQN